jgi:formate dehydrogenase gamma subunit
MTVHLRSSAVCAVSCLLLSVLLGAPNAAAQHPPVYLLDANGDFIDPINGENAEAPFSMKQTCGMCHDYDVITKGYHFQMGWDVISDDYGVESGRPWDLSNGFMGRWYPYAFRQLAKKENSSADEIDLTVYDFVGFSATGYDQPPCGACHPGGGGLEYDRDGNRYDEHLAANPELAESLDGDYYQSKWDASGVVEADCFVCHLEGYDFQRRIDQLKQGNYKWAVVAGSRIGIVEGSVRRGSEPTVAYHKRLFNADGTITLEMSWPPPDENCVNCHGRSDVRKRGFSWNDIFNPDIHQQQGISCTACHPAGLDHQIAKGDSPTFTAAPEHEGTMMDCEECHRGGHLGAPVPDHEKVRPSHVANIACESCHIPSLKRAAALGHEASTGELEFRTRPPDAEEPGAKGAWEPDYNRWDDGLVYNINHFLAVWWGNRDADGLIYPLFLSEHEVAWKEYGSDVVDDDEDGLKEVNRDEEIIAGLQAFAETLRGNERFSEIHPVFLTGEKAYELDESGELVSSSLAGTPLEGGTYVDFSINHNTAATRASLGATGCDDCHAVDVHFFKGQQAVQLHGPGDAAPITRSNGLFFGCKPWAFHFNTFHQQIVSPYIGPVIILVVFLIVVHYHSYGPKRITFDPYSHEIQRFSLLERGVHLFRLIAFVILAISGLILAFNLHLWQELLFGSAQSLLNFHIAAGIVFIITTIIGGVIWFRDAVFASYDTEWMRKLGGYLGHKGHVPAGRFNAGQKMFYWFTAAFGAIISITGLILVAKPWFGLATICATSTVHNLVGFFLIAGVLAHAYLGTVANPGTWRVLVDGSVTREWAHHHHPNWYRALVRRGEVPPEQDDQSTEEERRMLAKDAPDEPKDT